MGSIVNNPQRRRAVGRLLLLVNCVALLAVAVWLRVWRLDNMPGVNGDEAQYGVNALQWLRGEPVPLRTNTGNPLNVFFFVPQVLVHAVAPPSFALLRSVAAASGIAALVLNWILARRLLGTRFAVISTLLLAVLPVNIAYSRFAWDACQSLGATLLLLYGSLGTVVEPERKGRWFALAVLSGAAAVLIHPTNVFVLPVVALAVAFLQREQLVSLWNRSVPKRFRITAMALLMLAMIGAGVAIRMIGNFGSGGLPTLTEGGTFVRNYERLFTGVTVYRFIPGSQYGGLSGGYGPAVDLGLYDVAGMLIMALAVAIALATAGERTATSDRFLLLAWATTTVGFFLIAGPRAIEPHWERYGIVLVAPATLVLARLSERALDLRPLTERLAKGVFLGFAWLMLAGFYVNYFAFLEQTGGRSHLAFRTAAVEPKRRALEFIEAQAADDAEIWVIAPSWWSYWPLAYLAEGSPHVHVVRADGVSRDKIATAASLGNLWIVEFIDDEGAAVFVDSPASSPAQLHFIPDFVGQELLRLWLVRKARADRNREARRVGPG